MRRVSAEALLDAWEQGHDASPGERGLLLLAAAQPELSLATAADWSVGRRDRALLALRERVFGARLRALADCPRCTEGLEMDFPVSAIQVDTPPIAKEVRASFSLERAGYNVVYRLPTAGDLAELGHATPAEDPGRWLVKRCVVGVETGDGDADALPDTVLEALEVAIAESASAADPQAEIELAMKCPACAFQWQAPFDIVGFLWQELDAWATRLLDEVHLLASSYGWSERDIVGLSPWRRQRYLELIGA